MDEWRAGVLLGIPERQLAGLAERADEEILGRQVFGEEVAGIGIERFSRVQDERPEGDQGEKEQSEIRPDSLGLQMMNDE